LLEHFLNEERFIPVAFNVLEATGGVCVQKCSVVNLAIDIKESM